GIVVSGIGVQTATTTVAAVSECALPATSTATECTSADPASPAAAAGLEPGDVLRSIDGTEVASFAEASAIIQAAPDRSLQVVVDRGGEQVSLQMTPMLAEREVLGEDGQITTAEV